MNRSPVAQTTDFTRDVVGRYICNGFDEAMNSHQARPFDTVVIGAGAFGAIVAQHLFFQDQEKNHRILVLDAGPFVLPQHVQNLPILGWDVPAPVTQDPGPRNEVWGLPWVSDVLGGSVGLAYCVGGRSIFWGGWSPQPLAAELPSPSWPATVAADLNNSYLRQAADQLGVSVSNEFIYGPLQNVLRQQLFERLNQVTTAVPLDMLPDYQGVPANPTRADLLILLGLPSTTPTPPTDHDLRNMLKLEAPLAVQSRPPLPGFFALNKFSGVPLLMEAARAAWAESNGNNADKRLMLVPRCHVKRLQTGRIGNDWHVTNVDTSLGPVSVPQNGRVVLAMGTVENTRLALVSFENQGLPTYPLIGTNLQVHLRSNLYIRVRRDVLAGLDGGDLQGAALFVKGRDTINGNERYFHLQITASGLSAMDTDAERKLFKFVPDIDTIEFFRKMTDDDVIIAIRGVAQMEAPNAASHIRLDTQVDEYEIRRARVTIMPTGDDATMWDALDTAADQVAHAFAGNGVFDVVAGGGRDGLGTTYHEAGTLRMGDDANNSVTNADACFHAVDNLYVTGPAVFPATGSTNPMLAGVALGRRLADKLV